MKTSECIKNIRMSLGLNQSEFGLEIEKDRTSICLYESGKRKPSFPTIRKIVEFAKKNGIEIKYTDLRDDE